MEIKRGDSDLFNEAHPSQTLCPITRYMRPNTLRDSDACNYGVVSSAKLHRGRAPNRNSSCCPAINRIAPA